MKEADGRVDYAPHQMVLYIERADGSYGPLQTGSYMSKNYIDDFWEKRKAVENEAISQLTMGAISPVGYYILLLDMTPADVARRVGISVRRVKKHQLPDSFGRITIALLKRYADVFGVPIASLFNLTVHNKPLRIVYKKTLNPFVVLTEIAGAPDR